VALGLGAGVVLLVVLFGVSLGGLDRSEGLRIAGMLLGDIVLTSLVCAVACASPTVRALRLEPQEALRVD
jgi:hypothetical protein